MQAYNENKHIEDDRNNKAQSWVILGQIALRTLALAASVAASWITFSCKQTALVFGVPMDAKYSYSSASKFFAYATAISSVFTFLSLSMTFIIRRKGSSKGNHYFFFFLHDLVIMSLLLSGSAAATAIGFVGKYGNEHAGWMPICDYFHSFCHKQTSGVVLGYFGFICFFFLVIISATKSSHHITAAAQVQNI